MSATTARGACRGIRCSCSAFVPGGQSGGWQGCAACSHVRETHLVVKPPKSASAAVGVAA